MPTLPVVSSLCIRNSTAAKKSFISFAGSTFCCSSRALLVIAGIAADRGQPVGGERDEAGLGHAPRHILDIGVEAPVLMDHDHAGDLAGGLGRADQIAADLAIALGRLVGDVLRDDVRVGELDLLRHRIVRAQRGEDPRRAQPGDGEGAGAVEELALGDPAMDVEVVELEQLGLEVLCRETGHRRFPLVRLRPPRGLRKAAPRPLTFVATRPVGYKIILPARPGSCRPRRRSSRRRW